MSEDVSFLNGHIIPASQANIAVTDAGFMMGTTVSEQLRTFGGHLFRIEQHLDRLFRSLEVVGVAPHLDIQQMGATAEAIVSRNHANRDADDDLGLSIFVTPGIYSTFSSTPAEPLIGMHTYPLPFQLYAHRYEAGQPLVVPPSRQVPADCWPTSLKCRSRMHYYLADKQAEQIDPGSRALLLDTSGLVSEASTASVFIYKRDRGLIAPREDAILPGISLSVVKELADAEDIPFHHQDLSPDDISAADEVLLCSTSPCLLPVTRFEQRPIADGVPGPIYRCLLDAWSSLVGVDIAQQANRFSSR